jgi:hypothetical protein
MKHSNDIYTLLQNSILSHEPLIEPYLHSPPKGCIADRIAIYTDGFYGRLEETLLGDYQTLALLMGEDEFSQMCQHYVASYPSYSYSLNFFGQHLSKFLTETPPYNKKPHLGEIASYEWAEAQAFTAADATLLTTTELHLLPSSQWPEMKFYLHPSCHLLQMHWNSFALIKASRDGYKHPPRPKKMADSQSLIVWRRQLQVRYYLLDKLELSLLQAIKHNTSFIKICDHLSHEMKDEEAASYLVKKLYVWLDEQLLVHQAHPIA